MNYANLSLFLKQHKDILYENLTLHDLREYFIMVMNTEESLYRPYNSKNKIHLSQQVIRDLESINIQNVPDLPTPENIIHANNYNLEIFLKVRNKRQFINFMAERYKQPVREYQREQIKLIYTSPVILDHIEEIVGKLKIKDTNTLIIERKFKNHQWFYTFINRISKLKMIFADTQAYDIIEFRAPYEFSRDTLHFSDDGLQTIYIVKLTNFIILEFNETFNTLKLKFKDRDIFDSRCIYMMYYFLQTFM